MDMVTAWVAVYSTFYSLSTVVVFLRLALRHQKRSLRLSDALTAFAWVLSTIFTGLGIVFGDTLFDLLAGNATHVNPNFSYIYAFYYLSGQLAVPITKCCIISLLLEVEPEARRRRWLHLLVAFIGIQILIFMPLQFFGCYPDSSVYVWSILAPSFGHLQPATKCVDRRYVILVSGCLNGIDELLIVIAALSLVFRIKATTWQKIGLTCTFGLGIATMAASAIAVYESYSGYVHQIRSTDSAHNSQRLLSAGISLCVEVNIGLIISSLLPCRAQIIKCYMIFAKWSLPASCFSKDSTFSSTMPQSTASSRDVRRQADNLSLLEVTQQAQFDEAHLVSKDPEVGIFDTAVSEKALPENIPIVADASNKG